MIFIMCHVYTAITSSEFRQEGRREHASALQVYGVEGVAVSSFDWIRSLPYTEKPTVHVCIHFVRNQAIYGKFLMISRVRFQRRSRRFRPSGVLQIVRRRSYSVQYGPIELAQGKDKGCCERGKGFG